MRKTDKNVIKICYRKQKYASASGDSAPGPRWGTSVPQTPLITCAVQKFPLKSPGVAMPTVQV